MGIAGSLWGNGAGDTGGVATRGRVGRLGALLDADLTLFDLGIRTVLTFGAELERGCELVERTVELELGERYRMLIVGLELERVPPNELARLLDRMLELVERLGVNIELLDDGRLELRMAVLNVPPMLLIVDADEDLPLGRMAVELLDKLDLPIDLNDGRLEPPRPLWAETGVNATAQNPTVKAIRVTHCFTFIITHLTRGLW